MYYVIKYSKLVTLWDCLKKSYSKFYSVISKDMIFIKIIYQSLIENLTIANIKFLAIIVID